MREEKSLEKTIERSFKDPIAAILLKYSNMSRTQYECLIIDYVTDNMTDKRLTYDEKVLFRSKKVSRGSFSRTLVQARGKIISSIYTILLLVYVGIFDTAPFDEYKNLAEKLSEYLALIQISDAVQAEQILQRIERELLEGIRELASTRSLKNA